LPSSPDKRLAGRRILVTRPMQQALRLAALIEAEGGRALCHPSVEIGPPPDAGALARTLAGLSRFELAVFVSPTAVREALKHIKSWPGGLRAAAVGPGTKSELERHGVSSVVAPAEGADSEALLADPAFTALQARRIVVFRGDGGREKLHDGLVRRGAEVVYAECYRRMKPRDLSALSDEWRKAPADALTIFSATALRNLLELLPALRAPLLGTPVFASHARIAEEARRMGAGRVTVSGPAERDMVAGLLAYFDGGK
jgi:uroporphyrinogen-III synthase